MTERHATIAAAVCLFITIAALAAITTIATIQEVLHP